MLIKKKLTAIILSFISLIFFSTSPVFAAACPVTDGGVGDGDATVDGTITINASTTWAADSTNQGNFDCSGLNILVTNSSTLSLTSYDSGDTTYTNDYGVIISAIDLTIDSGAIISADAVGYSAGRGPGAGTNDYCWATGPSHGGQGHGSNGQANTYGNLYQPTDLGSSSGTKYGNNPGGGAIKLVVSGTLNNSGEITADGKTSNVDCNTGGSGGSILIQTSALAGSGNGIISTNGGTSESGNANGAGGGGRIAIYYATDSITGGLSSQLTEGDIQAFGINSATNYYSASGTIYIEHSGVHTAQQGDVFINNNNLISTKYAEITESTYTFNSINLLKEGNFRFKGSTSQINVANSSNIIGDSSNPLFSIQGTLQYNGSQPYFINGYNAQIEGQLSGVTDITIGNTTVGGLNLYGNSPFVTNATYTFGDITLSNSSTLTLTPYNNGDTTYTNDLPLTLNLNNLTINSGSSVTSLGLGYTTSAPGPGYGSGGSSYGGIGGNGSKDPYGNLYQPTDLGSANNYVTGGGAIKIIVSATLTNNGYIGSDSSTLINNWQSGATGGSVWIDTNILSGNGTIEADAEGNTIYANGGGGGRIALYYTTDSSSILSTMETSSPLIHAYGKTIHDNPGGAGTVYIEQKGIDVSQQGKLYLNNDSVNATDIDTKFLAGSYQFSKLVLREQASLQLNAGTTLTLTGSTPTAGDNTGRIVSLGTVSLAGTTTHTGFLIDAQGEFDTNTNNLTLDTNGQLKLYAWTQARADLGYNPTNQYNFDTLVVNNGGTLRLTSFDNGDADYTNDYGIEIISNSLTINNGGTITGTGLGFLANLGDGAGTAGDAGGTHAGFGAINCSGTVGSKYGSETQPVLPGSGGAGAGGGGGGGAIKLTTNGNMTINGTVSSNGGDATADNSGAGSGGSVWLYATGNISGTTGLISANGGVGNGTCRSGGGGGRVAISYSTNNYTGATQAIAGTGGAGAEGGSIYSASANSNPDAVSGLGPSNLINGSYSADTTPTVEFTLSDPDGDQVKYQIQIDDSSDFSSVVVDYTSALGATGLYNFTVGQVANGGTYTSGAAAQTLVDEQYYWRVQAIDESNAQSGYTTANGGSIAFGIDTTAPTTPGTPSTTTPTNDNTPTWDWTASTDSGSGLHATPYTVQWCQDSNFTGCDSNVSSSISNTFTHSTGLADGTWYFRVKARDAMSNETNYSSNGSVEIDDTPPTQAGTPSTTSPTSNNTPTWTWTQSLDDGVPVTTYHVQWCHSTNYDLCTSNTDTSSTTSYTHNSSLADGTWYFRVWSLDSLSNQSNYSQNGVVIIDTTNPTPPGTPTTTTPTNDTTPTWTWSPATDAGAGLGNPAYAVQWCSDGGFVGCESNIATTASNSFSHTVDLSDGTWYLRARAIDALSHQSSYSSAGSVVIDTSLPNIPGDPTTTTPTTDQTPIWSWAASYDSGDGQNVTNYIVEWCDNDQFLNCLANTDSTASNSFTHSINLSEDTWYFRAKAIDSIGNQSVFSNIGTVVVDISSPSIPSAPTTSNPTNDTTPTWTWTGGTDSISGLDPTAPFTFEWCDNSAFTDCLSNTGTSTTRSFTISTPLADGTWYSRVKAKDVLGQESAYSSNGSTLLDTSDPSQPGIPSTTTPTLDTTPTWTWDSVLDPDLDYYLIEWCSDDSFTTNCSSSTSMTNAFTHTTGLTDGYWYVRLQARDTAGNYSIYSPTGTVQIANNPPSEPSRPITTTPTTNNRPTWTWTQPATTGAGLGLTPYTVQWCQNSNFVGCSSNSATSASLQYTHISNLAEGTWYFRVNAKDILDNTSNWSLVGTVQIDISAPTAPTLIHPGDKSYINSTRPTFKWYSNYALDVNQYKLATDNGDTGDFEAGPFLSYSSSTINTDTYFANFINFQDSDSNNDQIELYTKSSNQWSNDQNDGELKQGERSWRIVAYDQAGNTSTTTRTVFVDLSSPALENLSIGGVSVSDNTTIFTSTPTFSGRVTDVRTGDHLSRYVASGPKKINILIEKQNLFGYETHSNISLNFDQIFWSDSGQLISDNTQNTANKTTPFSYNLSNSLANGTYRVTYSAQDIAGNTGSKTITLVVGNQIEPSPTPTPLPSPSPLPSLQPSPSPLPETPAAVDESQPATSSSTIDQVNDTIDNITQSINQTFDQIGDSITQTINDTAQQMTEIISNSVTQIVDSITQITAQTGETITQTTQQAINDFANAIVQIGQVLGEALPEDAQSAIAALSAPFLNSQLASNIAMTLDIWLNTEPTTIFNLKASEIGNDYAIITWETNHYATSKISYGANRDYGLSVTSDKKTKQHRIIISGLQKNTVYYYEVMSQGNNYAYDAWHEFNTQQDGTNFKDIEELLKNEPVVPKISNNPQIQQAVATVIITTVQVARVTTEITAKVANQAAPIAPAAATVAIPAVSLLAIALEMGKNFASNSILRIIQAIGLIPKSTPQGMIFNSLTQEPIPFALMTITGKSGDEQIKETYVSDVYGAYQGIDLPSGVYQIKVNHSDYNYPSKVPKPSYLGVSDYYQGNDFIIGAKTNTKLFAIPVDPKTRKVRTKISPKTWWKNQLKRLSISYANKQMNKYLLLFSILIFIFYPTPLNSLIVLLYIGMTIKTKLISFSRPHLKGVIKDHSGNPLTNVMVRISYLYNQLASATLTDKHGRFDVPMKKDQYFVEIIKPGFEPYHQKSMVLHTIDLRKKSSKLKIKMVKT